MTIKVELNPEMEARLAAEARAFGMALEEYAQRLLQRRSTPHRNPVPGRARTNFGASWMRWLVKLPMFRSFAQRPSLAR